MSDVLRFSVYGRLAVTAQRDEFGRWALYRQGADGKRSRLDEVVVPEGASPDEIEEFLEGAFHEYATPDGTITRIDG